MQKFQVIDNYRLAFFPVRIYAFEIYAVDNKQDPEQKEPR